MEIYRIIPNVHLSLFISSDEVYLGAGVTLAGLAMLLTLANLRYLIFHPNIASYCNICTIEEVTKLLAKLARKVSK